MVVPYRIDGRNTGDTNSNVRKVFPIKLISHKGYSAEAPENTLPAFTLSKEMGYNYVETDVQFTKDGVPVCLHDKSINRTARYCDGKKLEERVYISEITYEQALQYDFGVWKSSEYKNTKIPTFDQFIELCRDLGLHPYIELKANASYSDDMIKCIADIVSKYNMSDKVTYISFEYNYLEAMQSLCDSSRLGYLYNGKTSLLIERIMHMKTPANEVFVDSRVNCVTDVLPVCRHYNVPLEVWTVNNEKTLFDLNSYITGVTTEKIKYTLS